MTALVLQGGYPESWLDDVYLTTLVGCAGLVVVAVLGYLIVAREPKESTAFNTFAIGAALACLWPLALAGSVATGIVLGMRAVVHGRAGEALRTRSSRVARRDARILELEATNARLEHELGIAE